MLFLAFVTAFTLHLLLFSYSILIPSVKLEMNLSHAQAGLIFSTSILSIVFLRLPWGLLSDRIGFATTMKIAMIFIGISGVFRGFASNYEMLLLSQLLLGVGFAAILPCLPKLVYSWFRAELGFSTGVYAMGFPIGEIVALTLTPYLLTFTGAWRTAFQLFGAWGLTISALWWILGKESSTSGHESSDRSIDVSLKDALIAASKVRETWILVGLCISAMGIYDTLITWLPYTLEIRGMQPESAGLAASMLPLGFLLAGPVVGASSDRLGSRKPFILVLGLVGGPLILSIALVSGISLSIVAFLAGFSVTGILTLVLTIPAEHPRTSAYIGSSVGLISSLGNLGPLLIPIAVGYIMDIANSVFYVMAMLAVVAESAFVLGLILREPRATKET